MKFSQQDASRYDYWKRMEFTRDQWIGLKRHAEEKGLVFLSSPFSIEATTMLDELGVAAWKVASGETGNHEMLQQMIRTGKPILVSSGMSPFFELDRAIDLISGAGSPFAVFQCTSSYPTPPEKLGLNVLDVLRKRYSCPVGLSDHSGTIYAGLAARALNSDLLELHVTMSRDMFGPDVVASVTVDEFRQMNTGVRFIETAISNPIDKDVAADQLQDLRQIFTKSLFLAEDIAAGTELQKHHLVAKKPGIGISSRRIDDVLGKRLKDERKRGWMLRPADLEGFPA